MERNIIDRRKGPDSLVKLTGSISTFSSVVIFSVLIFLWILVSIILIVINVAKTSLEELFEDYHLPQDWQNILLNYSYYILILIFAVCAAGLFLNSFRHNRKTDKYKWSFIIFGILSLIGIVIHLINKNFYNLF